MKNLKLNSVKGWLMIIGLFLAVQAFGQQMNGNGRPYERHENMGPMRQRSEPIPNLSDDQKTKIEQLNLTFDKNTLQIRNQIREKAAQLRTLVTQDNANQDQINKLIDEIGSMRINIMKERVATNLKIRGLLTDDQKVIFDMRGMYRSGGMGRGRNM